MQQRQLKIINKLGLHARAATKLASLAGRFSSDIRVEVKGKVTDAKGIMSLMLLAAAQGTDVCVTADGEDEVAALDAIETLINDYFGEGE
ncbi:HPr family phosphocarrier protein [Teredinibacter waterburyi]|jgi:Phosphotransferase System HPr (HPr) Family|uniref:HPr family phosphocarrier protein n=1 Tax=Teredinibacter waterburyi TaxID=1500538 RepID=UPI00165F15F4|nr:HPr family phosphocarrier protein [Teredinibacter waterburyi]